MYDGLGNAPQAKPTIAEVQRVVCVATGITVDEIKSKCRAWRLSHPRQEAMFLARELCGKSYPQLSRDFGGRDHTTVLFAFRKIGLKAQTDADLEIRLNRYREAIAEAVALRPPPPPIPATAPASKPEPARLWKPERPKLGRKAGRLYTYYPKKTSVLDREAWESLGGELEHA